MIAIGFVVMLLAVCAGVHSGELGALLGFAGVLVGVRRMQQPALMPFLHRNLAVVGIILVSAAVTAVVGDEAGSVLCGALITLFLVGVSLINFAILGQ